MKEDLHKKLYEAHWLITSGAALLHEVVVSITADGRHKDTREKFRATLDEVSAARDLADSAWKRAAEARGELIRLTGCDGSCSASAV